MSCDREQKRLCKLATPEEIYNDFLDTLSEVTGLSKARLTGEALGEMTEEEYRVWEDTWRQQMGFPLRTHD